nr:hypothetical protein B0A51_01994 [Rachicladosporium sp. CCFEE 5018]
MDQFADFTIKSLRNSQTHSFPVHKAILCSKSSKLSAAIRACTNGELTIEHSAVAVKAMLQYTYTGEYVLDLRLAENSEAIETCYHASVVTLASEYDLTHLASLAQPWFINSAAVRWDQPSFIRSIANLYGNREAAVIPFRKEMVKIAADHVVELYTTATHSREFVATVQKYGTFAADLNAALVEKLKKPPPVPAEGKAVATKGETTETQHEIAGIKRDANAMKHEEVKVMGDEEDSLPSKRVKPNA